jgi:tight adherence protein B
LIASARSLGPPGSTPPQLRPVLIAAALPGDVAAALRRARPPPLRLLGAAWETSERRGAPLALVVTRLADGVRADIAAEQARESALAAPRASASVVGVLPVLGIALAGALGARPLAFLLHDRVGEVCLVVGVLLDLAAVGWTTRLTRDDER